MSYLYRNGNGRNNIVWGGNNTTSLNYLRRIGTSRNNIQWNTISSNGTYNILERTSSGRNNIQWKNTTFNFKTEMEINVDNFFNYINTATDYFMLKGVVSDYFGYYGSYVKYDGYYAFVESGDPDKRSSASFGIIGLYTKSTTSGTQLYNQLSQFVNKKLFTKSIPDRISNCEYYNITISNIEYGSTYVAIYANYESCSNSYFNSISNFYTSGLGKFYYK